MRIAIFSSKPYDKEFLTEANRTSGHDLHFIDASLSFETYPLAAGCDAVCLFVNDNGNREVLTKLAESGVKSIVLRSAGFNHIDLEAAKEFGMPVVRVPAYSPRAVAEHTLAMILTLNRKTHRAYNRVREGNFSLEGLLGFDLYEKTVGLVGTGKIGLATASILKGFGCKILAFDPFENPACIDLGVNYVDFRELLENSDIVSLHCPLTPENDRLIDDETVAWMRDGSMLINTSRGGLINSRSVIRALKSKKLGALGLDVYEEEADIFFEDLSHTGIHDDTLSRLISFPNVLVTSHQAFFTREALQAISDTTISNCNDLAAGRPCANQVEL